MQDIIAIVEKLESGESKKFSELRVAIAAYLMHRGLDSGIAVDVRTKAGKQKLLEFARQLINEYNEAPEEVEQEIDKTFESVEKSICEFQIDLLNSFKDTDGLLGVWAEIFANNPAIITSEGLTDFTILSDLLIEGETPKITDEKVPTWEQIGGLLGATDLIRLRRVCLDPGEFVTQEMTDFKEVQPDDNQAISFLKRTVSSSEMIRMGIKMQLNEQIQKFQKQLNVSGVSSRHFECRGLSVDYLIETWRLLLMARDARTLRRQVNPVVNTFIQLAKLDSPKYNLSRVSYEDDNYGDRGEDLPTTFSQIREVASKAVGVLIAHESVEWESEPRKIQSTKHGETIAMVGQPIDRPDEPDRILLYLTMGWKDFETATESDIVTFRLTHPHRD